MADQDVLHSELATLGLERDITSIRRLSGGFAADAWLVGYSDGSRVVGKTMTGAPADLFRVEAEGLAALRATGHVLTPEVLAVTDRLLLLEEFGALGDDEASWEAFAHEMAALHRGTVHEAFGWDRDGYLGRLVQRNHWTASGQEFFAEHRVLRYLGEPLVERALTSTDRRAVERFCDRLPEIVPAMPAVLTHGDLWSGNLLAALDGGRIALVDPAVSYAWAEVDLSMLWCCPRPPAARRFFEVYSELNPSPSGWAERLPLLHVREWLSALANLGDFDGTAQGLFRGLLAPFYPG